HGIALLHVPFRRREQEVPRLLVLVLQQLEDVVPDEWVAALEGTDDHGGAGEVVEDRLHVFRRHVDPLVLHMPAVAERTGEVAAPGELEGTVEGVDGFLRHLVPEDHPGDVEEPLLRDLPHGWTAPPSASLGSSFLTAVRTCPRRPTNAATTRHAPPNRTA